MRNLLLVAQETYLRQVKSWSFLFLVLSPFIMIGFMTGFHHLMEMVDHEDKIAVVSSNQTIAQEFSKLTGASLKYDTEALAKKAQKKEDIIGYITLRSDEGQLDATYYGEESPDNEMKSAMTQALKSMQDSYNLQQANLTSEEQMMLGRVPHYTEKINETKDLEKTGKYIFFNILSFLLYMLLLTYAGMTAQDIAAEKGNKVMEIILSSMPADQYFYGRLLGMFSMILTHIGVYGIGGYLAYQLLHKSLTDFQSVIASIDVTIILFIIIGLLLCISLSALLGAIVVRLEDVGKAIQPLMWVVIIAFVGSLSLGSLGKDIFVLKVVSYIPILSTFFMPLRLINGSVGNLEAILSLIIAVTANAAVIYIGGRIYGGLVLQTEDLGVFKSFKRGLGKM